MSLVAYDSSDESDDNDKNKSDRAFNLKHVSVSKQKGTVKIAIPSLKELEEEDSTGASVKPQKFQSGVGLFNLLPPPKNSFDSKKPAFVPYTLTKKEKKSNLVDNQNKQNKVNKLVLENRDCTSEVSESTTDNIDSDDDLLSDVKEVSGAVEANSDYFSLDTKHPVNPVIESTSENDTFLFDTFQTSSTDIDCSSNILLKSPDQSLSEINHVYTAENIFPNTDNFGQNISIDQQYSNLYENASYPGASVSNDSDSFLKDEKFLKLLSRKREFGAIDIIDVKADDQLSNKNEWMKSLTEETYRPSRKKGCMPTQQQKRKHQITYLAFQAKERELDLKNQWAMNSKTRRETQAKYGF